MKNDIFFKNLHCDKNNIWINKNECKHKNISYSENGHDECMKLEDNSYWYLHRNNCIISVIKKYLPKGVIFDIGGGNGFVTKRILDEGLDTILLEPLISGAINAKLVRSIPKVICATLDEAGFNKNSLPAVGLFDVLEHIEKDNNFIDRIFYLLEDEGLIYLTVPAYQSLWSNNDISAGHYRRYNKKLIEKLFDEKFEILFSSYFFSFLIPAIFIFRTIPFYFGYKKKNVLNDDTEFGVNKNFFVKLFEYVLKIEHMFISKCISIPIGTSYMVVARKISK